jgi:hypothetical protein
LSNLADGTPIQVAQASPDGKQDPPVFSSRHPVEDVSRKAGLEMDACLAGISASSNVAVKLSDYKMVGLYFWPVGIWYATIKPSN